MASWSSNPTCHYLKAIYRAPFWGSPGWNVVDSKGWGVSIFQKKIGWCKQTGVASASFASFWRDPLMGIYISSMEYIQLSIFIEMRINRLEWCCAPVEADGHWHGCHPATMLWSVPLSPSNDGWIFGYVHPLPWRYVPYQEGIICNQSSSKRDHCTYRNTRPAIQRSVLRVLTGTIQAPMRKVAERWQPLAVGFNGRIVLPLADCCLCMHRDVWRIEVHILY